MLIYLSILDTEEEKTKFEKIYDTYKDVMRQAAVEILKDNYLAEDAVHEALIRIAKNFSKVGEVESKKTRNFAIIIAKNTARTIRERESKYVKIDEVEALLQAKDDIEEDVFTKVSLEDIMEVIDSLPAVYKETTMLYWLEEYKISEVAKILDISVNTAQSRIQRGRKIVERLLKERIGCDGR